MTTQMIVFRCIDPTTNANGGFIPLANLIEGSAVKGAKITSMMNLTNPGGLKPLIHDQILNITNVSGLLQKPTSSNTGNDLILALIEVL